MLRSGIFIVNFEKISHIDLVFPLSTLKSKYREENIFSCTVKVSIKCFPLQKVMR